MHLVAVVMAGGTGTRLYPASRSHRPKQFLDFGGGSLLSRTADRVAFADEIVVSTREAHAERVHEHVPNADVLVEPESKDTGPALVYAAHRLRERYGECTLLCLPSDHRIEGEFESVARTATRSAVETGGLVTIGIDPERPATGYGYVRPSPDGRRDGATPVEAFHEKPDRETAEQLIRGGCYWNAGIFAWTPDALLEAARDSPLAPLVEALEAGDPAGGFAAVDPMSVDRAILEEADDVYVVPADVEWDDLGSWDALESILPTDESGNATTGNALTIDAANNVVASDGAHVSLVGVDDLVVAAYDDRVLVVPRDDAQRVREVVAELRERGLF